MRAPYTTCLILLSLPALQKVGLRGEVLIQEPDVPGSIPASAPEPFDYFRGGIAQSGGRDSSVV